MYTDTHEQTGHTRQHARTHTCALVSQLRHTHREKQTERHAWWSGVLPLGGIACVGSLLLPLPLGGASLPPFPILRCGWCGVLPSHFHGAASPSLLSEVMLSSLLGSQVSEIHQTLQYFSFIFFTHTYAMPCTRACSIASRLAVSCQECRSFSMHAERQGMWRRRCAS